LYDDDNNFQGYAKITRDITERKIAEAEVKQKSIELAKTNKELLIHIAKYEQSTTELMRSNKQLEQFVYIASHDLQEPLRTISNFVGLIEAEYKGQLEGDMNKYLGFIGNGAEKMKNLIKDLLDYSRLGLQTSFEEVDCNVVLNEVINEMQASIKESNAKISSAILPVLQGNKIQLKQLFQNLISNAIKFRKKNIIPEIEITVEEKNNEYLFAIKDNGIGIDERDISKLFVFFKRLHNATEYPGNGIGLTTAQKIVSNHNGRIWVNSGLNKGSIFFFSLSKKLESL
jgi:light-regulated signal transduction histidine kinase (bacteriophytochrome)